MNRLATFLLGFLLIANFAQAQEEGAAASDNGLTEQKAADGSVKKGCDARGYCWGENVEETKSKYTFFSDNMKAKNYSQETIDAFNYLYTNAPYIHKNLYIYGLKLYKSLVSTETKKKEAADKELIVKYEDTVLKLYDERGKYFGNPNKWESEKGKYLYRYVKDRPDFDERLPEYYAFYRKVAERDGVKTDDSNMSAYVAIVAKLHISYKKAVQGFNKDPKTKAQKSAILTANSVIANKDGKYTDAQIKEYTAKKVAAEKELENLSTQFETSDADFKKYKSFNEDWLMDEYDFVSNIAGKNIEIAEAAKKEKDVKSWNRIQTMADKYIMGMLDIDCDFINDKLGAKFKADPTDIATAKKIVGYSIRKKCMDGPYFIQAAEVVYAAEPTPAYANLISGQYIKKNETDKAIEWKEKAIELYSEDPTKQAETSIDLAKLYNKKGLKSQARSQAYKAIEFDSEISKEAYTFIGDLYMGSYKQCFESSEDNVQERGCYLAAYDMYKKAGNSSKMASAQKQFPSKSDIFTLAAKGYAEGKSIKVGCWIGGSTTLRIRP
ncbi:tetratricopeptide repeat protein [Flammeovirga kamogawensis]|uniref:Tetratricopeptide repeat protein n=1 Tax=Flammeovirga kamogawensis TaxID=373891 RepID=A0ABX8GT78_9BACT|nr:hypothetical protein [Flammeovirga kamogawensis]MBB6462497.1 hypothetical protein [Flammeovirga kamogawensis]QWG06766.1 hypothetical protein KM029_15865 [Flammeovirga kamogawensis]TRX68589.1 hypothetical protein EO216_10860 [Flammeovirga kamogawensis]